MNRVLRALARLSIGFALVALAALAATGAGVRALAPAVGAAAPDTLYIGDAGDNTVKQYDAQSGKYLGFLVKPGQADDLLGPRGLLVQGGQLLVANQNVLAPVAGDVLRYDLATGAPAGALVPSDDPHAPFAPRGIALQGGVLFAASLQGPNAAGTTCPPVCPDGAVSAYSATDGAFLRDLPVPPGFAGQFHPRGVVFGPDGRLYVSMRNLPDACGGSVVRYDIPTSNPATWQFHDVFVTNPIACSANVNGLHRPEGLVFGPDGNLYVTSFRADASDTDAILVFNPRGQLVGRVDLDQVGQSRAYAQALLFGPGGALFVPITNTGEVRRYDGTTHAQLASLVATGTLKQPWYLTFGQTDPATLAYR